MVLTGSQAGDTTRSTVLPDAFRAADRTSSIFSLDESGRATPSIPPGLDGLGQTGSNVNSEQIGRSTPTIPPGFAPQSAPIPDKEQRISRPASRANTKRTTSAIMPAVPMVPTTPARTSTLPPPESTPKLPTTKEVVVPTKASLATQASSLPQTPTIGNGVTEPKTSTVPTTSTTQAQTPVKKSVESTLKQQQQQHTAAKVHEVTNIVKPELSMDDGTTASTAVTPSRAVQKMAVETPQAEIGTPQHKVSAKPIETQKASHHSSAQQIEEAKFDDGKRKHPGRINMPAVMGEKDDVPVASSESISSQTNTPSKSLRSSTPSLVSRSTSPTGVIDKKTAPRTLRVVSTPRAETPPPAPVVSLPLATAPRIPSRKPSVASINPPGTPSSEHISDNVSLTSTSLSRANSPPPAGRIGSAPVRSKTKSQVKKERQERAKALEDEKSETMAMGMEESTQEAITSRKKKSRKASAPMKAKAPTSAANTRPATPTEEVKQAPAMSHVETPIEATEVKSTIKMEDIAPAVQSPAPVTQPELNPGSLLADLRSTSALMASCIDTFFRPLAQANVHYKPSQHITAADLNVGRSLKRNPDVNILPEQLQSMLKRDHPLRYGGEDGRIWSRGCVTPSGAHLRHLEPELEDRFLDLERHLRALPEDLSFRHSSIPMLSGGMLGTEFPQFDLAAIKRGFETGASRGRDANAMEKAVEEGSKKGSFLVGNAEQYVNEFVMPVSAANTAAKAGASNKDMGIAPQQAVAGVAAAAKEGILPSMEELERLIGEAKKIAEEKEGQLRKLIKKNRRAMGLTH